jgi:cell pole-organizing protein PopZ
VAAAAEQAAARSPASAPMPNGKATAGGEPPRLQGTLLDSPHNRALEAMVLDLLKPMLRQWLDENMPRLVAEALDDEVRRVRQRGSDAGKT